MSQIAPLLSRPSAWLNSPGTHGGVVISSRVRLARNLDGFAFQRKLSKVRQQELVDHLRATVDSVARLPGALSLRLDTLSDLERQALVERQLISRDLAGGKKPAGVYISGDEIHSLMFNEEDHLRLQVISAGMCVNANLELAVQLDRALEKALPWSNHPDYGYLTACPTNVGTGLRASVMLHLPALVETGEFKQVMRSLGKLHMTVRGLHGEGSEPSGHFYQVSNQRALGHSEQQIVDHLNETVERIIAYEQLAREALVSKGRLKLEDKVHRAWGLLTHARSLTSDELTDQLSWVRLGVSLRVIAWQNWKMLDRIFLQCQPAHIQLQNADAGDVEARDRLRAELVRKWLLIPPGEQN
ncbi:MAG: protein arginine kinase [Planctomycetes bacterium]|jgi:protein arginine kinase|nr:protein arginine kinase [Planctomycetota bacterium]